MSCTMIYIRVHSVVKAIKNWAFDGNGCRQLTTVILNDGLEEIGAGAFRGFPSLVRIVIPPVIKVLHSRSAGG